MDNGPEIPEIIGLFKFLHLYAVIHWFVSLIASISYPVGQYVEDGCDISGQTIATSTHL